MAWKTMDLHKWARALTDGKEVNGDSPGGAASRLGVSRQHVHKLIEEDKLDAIRVESGGRLSMICVGEKKLRAYMLFRDTKQQRRAKGGRAEKADGRKETQLDAFG